MRREYGPERLAGQGLDANQYESGDRTIAALLGEAPARDQVDLAITWRDGAYEVWARRGMIRFKRYVDDGGALHFEVIEQLGENPVANQDPFAVSTIAEELSASAASGHSADDPNRAFLEPHVITHPYAYERIAQLFDSPRAPDIAVSPKAYTYGIQPGQHGALDVVQSRAPLIFSGPGVKPGRHRIAARHVDIAPSIAHLMGFPKVAGAYLKRQDGRPLDELIDSNSARPLAVYMILLDGLSHSELMHHLENNRAAIPNLVRLIDVGAMLTHGSIVNFPSITWPSHSTIMTGAWCGHHDIVNPTYHERARRETVPVQGMIFDTERFLSPEVETLYEAFKRVYGEDTITVSIHEPQGRGADHNVFEKRVVGDKIRLKDLTIGMMEDISSRWMADEKPAMHREEVVDIRGMAQLINLLEHCGEQTPKDMPKFIAHEFVLTDGAGHDYGPHHEGMREALYRTDARIGKVLELLDARGMLDATLFVITSDHGMAAQDIALNANPTVEPVKAGIKGIFAEPMIYLRDMHIECVRANDRRTLRVTVLDNDFASDDERPAIEGAKVKLLDASGAMIGEATTSVAGIAAFATAGTLRDEELVLEVEHADFNRRRMRLDGTPLHADIRKLLYS
ncbi:MAG TPA: alkaline phosphatase family protein [Candidatus Binataceae bacterium]|nr:alkaline phosphatase family protein [Candidatus Binataceae bacterium]